MGLELVEVVLALEEEFGVRLADDAFANAKTVDDLVTIILAAHPDGSDGVHGSLDRTQVRLKTRTILSSQLDVPVAKIQPETRLLDLMPYG